MSILWITIRLPPRVATGTWEFNATVLLDLYSWQFTNASGAKSHRRGNSERCVQRPAAVLSPKTALALATFAIGPSPAGPGGVPPVSSVTKLLPGTPLPAPSRSSPVGFFGPDGFVPLIVGRYVIPTITRVASASVTVWLGD